MPDDDVMRWLTDEGHDYVGSESVTVPSRPLSLSLVGSARRKKAPIGGPVLTISMAISPVVGRPVVTYLMSLLRVPSPPPDPLCRHTTPSLKRQAVTL